MRYPPPMETSHVTPAERQFLSTKWSRLAYSNTLCASLATIRSDSTKSLTRQNLGMVVAHARGVSYMEKAIGAPDRTRLIWMSRTQNKRFCFLLFVLFSFVNICTYVN